MNTDKGHLMGLELGGPDISENIAPQSSLWQQSGGWRIIEKKALECAMYWMGIDDVYDPALDIPEPSVAAYFRVSPSSEFLPTTMEPKYYEGCVTKISMFSGTSGIYKCHSDQETHLFIIEPGKTWWNKEQVLDGYSYI